MTPRFASRPAATASYPALLNLPEGETKLLSDAASAVDREYRSSARWKRLRCRGVRPRTDDPAETIFVLDVGHSVEFDWTWEGAVAFRPASPGTFRGDCDLTDDFTGSLDADTRPGVWQGEVVEVDETNGVLYVSVSDPANRPCTGVFFVRPFEFLAFLHALFCEDEFDDLRSRLPPRLKASCGGVHPAAAEAPYKGLPDFAGMWRHSWGVLWGPPGCGKTTSVGRQVAACLGGDERVLVVSTTNKATDAAALAVGKAALSASPDAVAAGRILRIGKGADHGDYMAAGLTGLLRGTETDLLRQVGSLKRELEKAAGHEERAVLRSRIQELRRLMKDNAFNVFASPDVKVAVATAFKAVTLLCHGEMREQAAVGKAPFTTVVIDEAGLMPRAVVAGMSLLASRRVVVVGDSKQLAPISKMSRVLPTSQAAWLASSCLTHLQQVGEHPPGVHLLRDQHRMHPDIRQAVSHYQYEGALRDAPGVAARTSALPPLLAGQPRAVWYVLDEDRQDLPSIRADRGPGNRSWVRPATRKVLDKLFSDAGLRDARGLFITPFKAQAREIAGYFAEGQFTGWSAGTVHSRQGIEADVVIFDTVNAGSCAWPYEEWKRLVNVGLSRAREFVILIASRAEMSQPYLRPLLGHLAPRVLQRPGRGHAWVEVAAQPAFAPEPQIDDDPDLLGSQLHLRRALRPVMSREQQQLCGYRMEGGARLVRGVAGSGKTMVLAHWLNRSVRQMAEEGQGRVWAVYANRSLQCLIEDNIDAAWQAAGGAGPCPLGGVDLHHVKHLLEGCLLPEVRVAWDGDPYDYDGMAAAYLERRPFEEVEPRCDAMFIDEAQDMGPNTLKLLAALVRPTDPAHPRRRAVNIFYDDAQNIYGRRRPTWSAIGLDMQGRSTVMRESFRSTRPITEFALNVLYRLQPPDADADHQELVRLGLIERASRNGRPWWNVRFNQVEGPEPLLRKLPSLDEQIDELGRQVVRWIRVEGVRPADICILYNGKNIAHRLREQVAPMLRAAGSDLTFVGAEGWNRAEGAVLASTSHSYKGFDSEVVVIAGVEQFIAAERGVLANTLYVAMTRARSVLAIYAYEKAKAKPEAHRLLATLTECHADLLHSPKVEEESLDDVGDQVIKDAPEGDAYAASSAPAPAALPDPPSVQTAAPVQVRRAPQATSDDYATVPPREPCRVDCAVFAPPQVTPGEYYLVQVFAFASEAQAAERATATATQFDDAARLLGIMRLERLLHEGQMLQVRLSLRGAEVEEPTQGLTYQHTMPSCVSFCVCIPAGRRPGNLIGTVHVGVDEATCVPLNFQLIVTPHCAQPGERGPASG